MNAFTAVFSRMSIIAILTVGASFPLLAAPVGDAQSQAGELLSARVPAPHAAPLSAALPRAARDAQQQAAESLLARLDLHRARANRLMASGPRFAMDAQEAARATLSR